MRVPLMGHFHPETSAVQNVRPGVDYMALAIKDALIKVQTVQIERHRTNAKSSEPDTNNRPSSQKKVKASAIVKGCVLEDKASEITVGGHNVIRLFFLTELVSIIL